MTFTPPNAGRARRGLLTDYGGVLTTSVFESFHAFERAEGLERGASVRLLRDDARAGRLLAGMETGATAAAAFEAEIGAMLGVSPGGLLSRMFAATRPQPEMIDAVRAARRAGVRTALLSNSWGEGGYPEASFAQLFDAVVISGRVGLRKPDPAIYRLAADRLGLEPGDCVFVDDLPGNLQPAERLGMAVILHREPAGTLAALGRLLGLDLTPGRAGAGAGTRADPDQPR
ncbi:HAD family phosphatase [Actinocrinis puniceicyclus]|uniref:HAD family phosphatase n=1 Tax=Actinocrinis puniceicyclus TaxID=977794 RepID=A0A8J7WU04_9ACTN|nr:HAD family phosphatase [Actinocrinis puniceicyclus]MBS2965715.1 HAD family phosphatase [Actinocrinis puniceicyclus]